MYQKYNYTWAMFDDNDVRNKWILDYETGMTKDIRDGVTDAIDSLFDAQDKYFGLEQSNYEVSHQLRNTISYTEIGDDDMPMDMHFEIRNVDVDAEDLVDIFNL